MSLLTTLKNSRQLMRSSLAVIHGHPRLLLFPVVSSVCAVVLAAFFFSPLVVWLVQHGAPTMPEMDEVARKLRLIAQRNEWLHHVRLGLYAYAALIYFVSLVTAAFFNVAFYHEILRALNGGGVSLGNGLRFAATRWRAIVAWSLLAGTVGLIIRSIEERLGWIGRVVMGMLGAAWSVAAVFAIPVIVRRDESNPVSVLRDSATTLKRTWGESVVGYAGIQFAGVGILLVSSIAMILAVALAAKLRLFAVIMGLGAGWFLGVVALGILTSMATHIYRCALYVYATEGVVPAPFSAELMDAGWRVKKA